jgi:putative sugar O-methyltransferase
LLTKASALNDMISEMDKAPAEVQPSKYWQSINEQHFGQLDIRTFKRSLSQQYFTFFLKPWDPQIKFLHSHLRKHDILTSIVKTLFSSKIKHETKKRSLAYTYLTILLWEYISCLLPKELLNMEEPLLGSPLLIKWRKRYVTQDLGNSLLEYHTISKGMVGSKMRTILELGAGYGRLAYVFIKQIPNVQYIIADIPPALFIAQSYLSKVFEQKKIFHFRPFTSFAEIQKEYSEAEICFFLPHQLNYLPSQSVDLCINISSLHEMTAEKIRYYFNLFSKLLSGYFYFKQWKESYIPYDDVTIREADYPIPEDWEEIFWRSCSVQTLFFEALFKKIIA